MAERLETLIRENARVAQDQTAYLKQENEIRARYVEKQGNLEKLDEDLWSGLLDYIVVKKDGQIVVVFKGGIESGVGG